MAVEPPPLPEAPARPGITPKGDRRVAFAVLLAGVACLGMGQTVVFTILPPLGRRLGLADFQVTAIFMLSAMFWVAFTPRWGRLSDHRGRKPLILIGLAGFVVSTILFATSIELGVAGVMGGAALYTLIVLTRSIYGIVGSATPGAAQGYIADRTPPERRTAGAANFSAAFGLGAMFGPGLGGLIAGLAGAIAPLYAVAGIAAAMTAVIFFFLPEKTPPIRHAPVKRAKLRLSDARIAPFLFFGLLFGVINAVPLQTTAFYFMDRLHLTPEQAPQIASIGLTGSAIASFFAQIVIVQRLHIQPHRLMRIAPALFAAGHVIIVFSSSLAPLVIGLVLSGLGAGMALPGFTGAAMLAVSSEEQGAAAGLANSASASGFVFSPIIAMSLYALAPQAPYVMTSAFALALFVFAMTNGRIRAAGRFTEEPVNR